MIRHVLEWVASLGPWGPVVYILVYVAATIVLFPASIVTLAAGAIFGLVEGCIVVSVASTLAATAAFLFARYLARGWVARKLRGYPRFEAVDEAVREGGGWVVLLMRLSPVFPFVVLNYALGLSDVSLGGYVLGSWVGMLPATVVIVYLGSLAGSVAAVGGPHRRTPAEWALYAVGLAATLVMTVYVTRLAKKALDRRLKAAHG